MTSERNSESLIKWSEIQTVIILHIYLSKNTWGAKIWRLHAFWATLTYIDTIIWYIKKIHDPSIIWHQFLVWSCTISYISGKFQSSSSVMLSYLAANRREEPSSGDWGQTLHSSSSQPKRCFSRPNTHLLPARDG